MKSNNYEKLTWPFLVNITSGLVVEALMTLVKLWPLGTFNKMTHIWMKPPDDILYTPGISQTIPTSCLAFCLVN